MQVSYVEALRAARSIGQGLLDAGEITDKGYLNQRAILTRRVGAVLALYAGGPDVIRY